MGSNLQPPHRGSASAEPLPNGGSSLYGFHAGLVSGEVVSKLHGMEPEQYAAMYEIARPVFAGGEPFSNISESLVSRPAGVLVPKARKCLINGLQAAPTGYL
jgi:hypothetical protein